MRAETQDAIQYYKKRLPAMRDKIIAAATMFAISFTMMVSSAFAWVAVSTAPEATNITTTISGNGYLEIALQSGTNDITGYTRNPVYDFDRSTPATDVESVNRTWGNVINLDNDTYGLDYVTLLPARLKLTENYAVSTESFLEIPVYSSDGRIIRMNNTERVYYNGTGFTKGMNLGVSVHGNSASEASAGETTVQKYYNREDFVVMMSRQLADAREDTYNSLMSFLDNRSDDLLLVFKYFGGDAEQSEAFTVTSSLLTALEDLNLETTNLLRYVLMAKAASDLVQFPPDDEEKQAELSEMYSAFNTWDYDTIYEYASEDYLDYPDVLNACVQVSSVSSTLSRARRQLKPDSVLQALLVLINFRTKDFYAYQNGAPLHNSSAAIGTRVAAVQQVIRQKNGDFYIANGVFYNFAHILGDYEVQLTSEDYNIGFHVNGSNDRSERGNGTDCNPSRYKGYIYNLTNSILNYISEEEDDYGQIYATVTQYETVNAFGYSIDLAFRSNAPGNLVLQQSAVDRVTGTTPIPGSAADPLTQGSGSTMSFTFANDLTDEQVRSLMQSVYVVFVNEYNRVLAVASAGSVTVNNTTATSDLVLYNYDMSDGILKTGSRRNSENQAITALTADRETYITAIVYLSGDAATAAMVSTSQTRSLRGSVNLQFSHSGDLTPMDYSFD